MYETSSMMLYKGMKASHDVYLIEKNVLKTVSKTLYTQMPLISTYTHAQ